MTILPKKKHEGRKGEDHEGDTRNRNRNRTVRESRAINNRPGLQQEDLPEASSNVTSINQIFDDIDCRESQDTSCLPHKRIRHSRQTGTGYSSSSSSSIPNSKSHHHRSTKTRIGDKNKLALTIIDSKEDEVDGYNSSDEYDPCSSSAKATSAENIIEIENNFEHELRERKGFNIKQMATDGACMFRAVADQVYGDQEMHSVVRRHCMDYMMKNRDFFSQYVTEDFTSYVRRKRNDHSHGNHIEMQALSEMYNRPIEVYQYSAEPINTFHSRTYNHDETPPIRLSYHGNVHYNSIVDPYNPTVGVGLGLAGYKPEAEDEHSLNAVVKESEALLLEQAMLEDKLKATDWEATDEDLAEIAARESYLQWLKDNNQQSTSSTTSGASSSKSTSTKSRRSPPKDSVTNRRPSPQHDNSSRRLSPRRASPHDWSTPSCSTALYDQQTQDNTTTVSTPWNYTMVSDAEWDNDPVLAAVLAQSQQEYIDSLKSNPTSSKGNDAVPPDDSRSTSCCDNTSCSKTDDTSANFS